MHISICLGGSGYQYNFFTFVDQIHRSDLNRIDLLLGVIVYVLFPYDEAQAVRSNQFSVFGQLQPACFVPNLPVGQLPSVISDTDSVRAQYVDPCVVGQQNPRRHRFHFVERRPVCRVCGQRAGRNRSYTFFDYIAVVVFPVQYPIPELASVYIGFRGRPYAPATKCRPRRAR